MPLETGRIELGRRRCVQKLRHQPRYTAGGDLAVPLADQYQVPMARKSAGRAFRIGRGRHGIRLARQQQCRDIALQGGMQIGIHRSARPELANLQQGIQLIRTLVGSRNRGRVDAGGREKRHVFTADHAVLHTARKLIADLG